MARRTGRPFSSVTRPATMIRSPIAVLPSTTDRSACGAYQGVAKRGAVASVSVVGMRIGAASGCRFAVLR
jgi:hypothetical protein